MIKEKLSRKEYLKNYQKNWIKNRRIKWLNENGPCSKCDSWERLELDHINPKDKTSHHIWSWEENKRELELQKCQVLCFKCHKEKTKKDIISLLKGRPNVSARKYSDEFIKQILQDFYTYKISARQIAKNRNIPRGTVSALIYDTKKKHTRLLPSGRKDMHFPVKKD